MNPDVLRPRTARSPFSALEFGPPASPAVQRALIQCKANLAEPFRGITAGGDPVPGLFPLRTTGAPLTSVVDAADELLAALTPQERAAISFPVEDNAWRSWHNIHRFVVRHGLSLFGLEAAKRERVLALVRESMSAAGFEEARAVMKLNEHIGEITGRRQEYDEWYYWISLMGTPSASEPWGWQIDGHHLIVNCMIVGDQLVMTPTFIGSEPCVARFGKYAGTRVLYEEQDRGLAFMRSLTTDQQGKAGLGLSLPDEVVAGPFRDNLVLGYEGIRYGELSPAQQASFLDVVSVYVGRIRPDHARLKLEEVEAQLDETWFAWAGRVDDTSPFYYRIHGPTILIEFDHQPGVALDNDEPSRNHIHTVVRTPNGNDYGLDLLRQHYEQHDHSHPHTSHRLGLE